MKHGTVILSFLEKIDFFEDQKATNLAAPKYCIDSCSL